MQAIEMSDHTRPFYLQLSTNQPRSWEVPEDKRWDFELNLYMPRFGDARVDCKLIEEFQHYMENWGYETLAVLRESPICGIEAVQELTFQVKDPHKAHVTDGETRPDVTQLGVLRQLANVKYMVAGTARLEELCLDGSTIAHKATFSTTEGMLGEAPDEVTDGERQYAIERVSATVHTAFVQGVGDTQHSPGITANWLANELGLFLLDPIGDPTRVELHRTSQLCRS